VFCSDNAERKRDNSFLAVLLILALLLPLAVFAAENDDWQMLFQQRGRNIPLPDDVAVKRDVEFGKGGEKPLLMDIITPKEKPEEAMPVLVFIHGGGWRGGDKASGYRRLVDFAQKGYFCATINYRLSGEAHFPAQIEDCKCAIRFLRSKAKKYGIDSESIGVWGSSAGGHLVALLGTSGGVKELEGKGGHEEFSSEVQAVCDWFGPSDLVGIVEKGVHSRPNNPIALLLGGPVKDNLEAAKLASPVTHIDKDDPPFLIMHGEKDPVVPIAQSELLHKKLKETGVESKLKILKGMGHGGVLFEDPLVTAMIVEFFDKHLRSKKSPQTEKKESEEE